MDDASHSDSLQLLSTGLDKPLRVYDHHTMDIETHCSRHFRYIDLIQCGETWHRLASEATAAAGRAPIDNLPKQPGTWQAIADLAVHILDPLVDAFGAIELTYGFAGPALTRHIRRRIAPRLDQHAGYELRSDGQPICVRGGMAADFYVPNVPHPVVIQHLVAGSRFDRLYIYKGERPLHVSYGPEVRGMIVRFRRASNERMIPQVQR